MRGEHPIAFVPQRGDTLFTRRAHIAERKLSSPRFHAATAGAGAARRGAVAPRVRRVPALDLADCDEPAPRRAARHGRRRDAGPEDRVCFMFGSANRDEAFFDEPDLCDLGRSDSSAHIAFGAGLHYRAGAAPSKAQVAEVALPATFERLPGLRRAPGAELRFGGWVLRGPLALPMCWG